MSDIFAALKGLGVRTEDALYRFSDDEEMYLKYVRDFPEEPTMNQLVAAVEAQDYETAEHASHALKGITRNLGFTRLADASTDMNDELKHKNVEDALDAYEDVKNEYRKYCDAIISWRNEA